MSLLQKGVNALEAACLFPAGFKIHIDSVFGAACAALHPASAEAPTAVILLLGQHNLMTVQRNLEFVQVHTSNSHAFCHELLPAVNAVEQCRHVRNV